MKQQWYIMEEVMPCANINMHLKFSFKDELRNGKKWYTDMISWKKRDELVTWQYYNKYRFNKLFYSESNHYQTFFFMQKNNKFHILQPFEKNYKIAVLHRYHENAPKHFLRYCQYVGIYKLPNFVFNYNPTIYDFYMPK